MFADEHGCAPMRMHPSGRKRRLANLRRRLILPDFGASGSGQLQHGGRLAHTQAREQHHLPVREFQCIVMGHGVTWSSPVCPGSGQAGSRHGVNCSHTSKALSSRFVGDAVNFAQRRAWRLSMPGSSGWKARQQPLAFGREPSQGG